MDTHAAKSRERSMQDRGRMGTMRKVMAVLVLLSLGTPSPAAEVSFGKDLKPERAREILMEVRPGLLMVVKATPEGRDAAIDAFFPKADGLCEGWKRFRNPELKPLFVRLTEASDWHTRHRALLALEYLGDPASLPAAWKQLLHTERRVREKAAIACIKLWDKRVAPLLKPDFRKDVEEMVRAETDLHVRACYEAFLRRIDGTLPVVRMTEEFTEKGEDGLVLAPYLDDWENRRTQAPGFVNKVNSQPGTASAAKSPVSASWTVPVLGCGKEEVPAAGLPPFGEVVPGERIHVGQDYAACMDGAGFYAVSDGVVKILWAGWDLGTTVGVEHRVAEDEIGTAVYLYGGDTVFVKPGERVKSGQLLGTVGMGFSTENGGVTPHLHFAVHRGPYEGVHLIPFEPAAKGLQTWLDPGVWLPRWKDGRPPGTEETASSLLERAGRLRKAGYPRRALWVLTAAEKARKGTPCGDEVGAAAKAWREDPAFKKALAGEAGVAAAEEAASKPGKSADPKVKKTWESLLAAYGQTDLGPRIREGMER
ncbi:MAG: peptidoglycan DD-metalloendopeptidase family protein [Planctomycetaceae bacterium]|nr:peptidoglycan DD-metalloendopeptidase family protein [Planctomycetota bacterium]NUN51485.1 peptidoglycan DD-metalloendopeptidase family protein [Planctomycetaceae bacterium]